MAIIQTCINQSSNLFFLCRYEITPQRIYVQSDPNNYNIDDLDSGDSTDDDDRPRKAIPAWACGMYNKYPVLVTHQGVINKCH